MQTHLPERAEAMIRRLDRATRRAGLDESAVSHVGSALRLALGRRAALLSDDHHPQFLHPARTALILLEDLGVTDPRILAAGALAETIDLELALEPREIENALGPEIRSLVDQVPVPARAGDELVEALVIADEPVRLIALAERMDHARHLHLRPTHEWLAFHQLHCQVYLPIAQRTHPTLTRRYRWWCNMFQHRYLAALDPTPSPAGLLPT